ncbi:helix-turn-helix domain-containing protein [Streptomyces olivoreticuli]
MATPITNTDREQVRRLHAEGRPRNEIARTISRSASTVSKIACGLGLEFSGGARVAAATEARRADAAARR